MFPIHHLRFSRKTFKSVLAGYFYELNDGPTKTSLLEKMDNMKSYSPTCLRSSKFAWLNICHHKYRRCAPKKHLLLKFVNIVLQAFAAEEALCSESPKAVSSHQVVKIFNSKVPYTVNQLTGHYSR